MRHLSLLARLLLLGAFVAALLAAPSSASTLWPDGAKHQLTTLAKPGLAAWVAPCGPSAQLSEVAVRSLAGGLGPVKVLGGCGNYIITQPALTSTSYHNRLYVVWSQAPVIPAKSAKPRGIYVSFSEDSGDHWSKPRLIFPLKRYLPPPVKAAAYVQALWVMWADSFSANPGKDRPFHIAPVNAFNWKHGPEVSGVSKFGVFPDSNSMILQATKDGVAAFWLTFNIRHPETNAWYFADTQRVNPFSVKNKAVSFVFRGKVGQKDHLNIFTGLDGRLYRQSSYVIGRSFGTPYQVYVIDRWAFASHQFLPLFKQAPPWPAPVSATPADPTVFLVLPQSSSLFTAADVASEVDASHGLHFVYTDPEIDPASGKQAFPVCQVNLTFACSVAVEAQPFKSMLQSLYFSYPSGQLAAKTALPMPVATAPAGGSWGQMLPAFGQSAANTFVSSPSALYLFAAVTLAPVQSQVSDYYYVDTLDKQIKRYFYLSDVVH